MRRSRARLAFAAFVGAALLSERPVHGEPILVRGDSDVNASYELTDMISLLGYLFLGTSEASCLDAGDSNYDGRLDVSDAVYSLLFFFVGGSPPQPAFPGCGENPTEDAIGCVAYTSCPAVSELNEVTAIRTVGPEIEIELYSPMEFPARALFPILCTGGQSFVRSRGGGDGSLNALIFTVTVKEFAQTRTGDSLTVKHGSCEIDLEDLVLYWDLWVVGVVDKALLDREFDG